MVFFYSDNGLLASPWLACLQTVLDLFTGMFDRVGINNNINKMVGMFFQPCHMAGRHSEFYYERRMTRWDYIFGNVNGSRYSVWIAGRILWWGFWKNTVNPNTGIL